MTLTVRISNEGNLDTDGLILRGVTPNYYTKQKEDGCVGSFVFGGTGTMYLGKGQSALLWPTTDHFKDFDALEMKGKH